MSSLSSLVPGFDSPYFLAGLAGYSDGAMRLVSRRYGCPFCVTESLDVEILLRGGRGLQRHDPDRWIADLRATPADERRVRDNVSASIDDHPLAAQIIGENPLSMGRAAALLSSQSFDVIDVNLACPSKKSVRKKLRGGNLLAEPEHAVAILREVRDAVPKTMPTTVKLRRSYDDTPAMALAFDRIIGEAFELGYAWATVHGRTVEQRYDGDASWPFLRETVKRHRGARIFGSGDVFTADAIVRMIDATGVAAVAVARGAIGNPWIFREARALEEGRTPAPPSDTEMRQVLEEHAELAIGLHGPEIAGRLMRKFGIKFSRLHERSDDLRRAFVRATDWTEWTRTLDRFFPQPDGPSTSSSGDGAL